MASDDPRLYGRSASRAPRKCQDVLTSEQRSLFGGKKSQQKTVSDKLVWFSPVHSPLLSPAREKAVTKKKVRQSSIFSIQGRGKGSIVAEEPTSPKVSCIGQVRGNRKEKDPFADALRKNSSHSKPGSMSPARFFASPGRPRKWGSLFGSRKDAGSSTPSSAGIGDGYPSDYSLPVESRTTFRKDKNYDFLARLPDLFQERRSSDNVHYNWAMRTATDASDSQAAQQGVFATSNRCIAALVSEKVESHTSLPSSFSHSFQKKGCCELPGNTMLTLTNDSDVHRQADFEVPSKIDRCVRENPVLKQRLNYEDLPSLHCSANVKQNMKISVEVVPETWLWRNGETLRPQNISHMNCASDRSVSTSREDLQNLKQEEVMMPVSPCGRRQADKGKGDQCAGHQVLPCLPHKTGFQATEQDDERNVCFADVSPNCAGDSSSKALDGRNKILNSSERTFKKEGTQSKAMPLSCSTRYAAVKENMENFHIGAHHMAKGVTCVQSEIIQPQIRNQQVHLENSRCDNEAEENRSANEFSELRPSHQMPRRVDADVGKENFSVAFPCLSEKSLSSLQSNADVKQFWRVLKNRKAEECSEQPFSALILVGYDQLPSSKDLCCKDEEFLRGILEVGRLSFHGPGKYFQVLSSDAAFNRSRSATSVRTVFRLQRCNSDPCRPYF